MEKLQAKCQASTKCAIGGDSYVFLRPLILFYCVLLFEMKK